MNYCRVNRDFDLSAFIESGDAIITKETSKYIYFKCNGRGPCDQCEKVDREKFADYFVVSVEDEEGNTITFEPKFAGEP